MWASDRATGMSSSQPMIEALESRQMMSVAPHVVAAAAKPTVKPAVVVAAKPVAKPVAKPAPKPVVKPAAKPAAAVKPAPVVKSTPAPTVAAFPAFVQSTGPIKADDVVGGWTGSMQLDGSTVTNTFSVNFSFQRGLAASGTFDLGATMGNRSVLSTMVFALHGNMRVLLVAPGFTASLTGVLSSNGLVMMGRFCFNTTGAWQTGMFTLSRD